MTPLKKSLIGAAAGVCMMLVKFYHAGFYLDPMIPWVDVWGGLLTAGAFIVITVIFTAFLDETNPRKLFMQGLLAPSFIVALVQPAPPPTQNDTRAEQNLAVPDLLVPLMLFPLTVHAEQKDSAAEPTDRFPVKILPKEMFEGSLTEGARRLVGRTPVTPHAYIIGKTSNKEQASKLAEFYEGILDGQTIRLWQPEGSPYIYLSVGDFGSSRTASIEKENALQKLKPLLTQQNKGIEQKYVIPLIEGRVVSLRKISQQSP